MSTELTMLAWAIVLGLVHITIAAVLSVGERGLGWAAGPRDGTPPPIGPLAARMSRASVNFVETFAFFAAAVLAVMVAGKSSETTMLGAQIYFWARVVYIPAYAVAVPFLRSLVWTVSVIGIVMVLIGLFH
ncbi:MAG: MAPEG family protein [Dokdonella sp.]